MTTPLRFRRLDVRLLEGLGRGGIVLDDLGDGINIVLGPNASGKTRTTSAIRWLLWPARARKQKAALSGRFEFAGHEWTVDFNHGDVRYTRDRAQADAPTLPSSDVAGRYTLGLHEMLRADHHPLAETIIRESAGGYDPAAAAKALKYRKAASNPKKEPGAVKDRRKAYEKARDEQEAIQRQENTLGDLKEQLTTSEKAAARLELLSLAGECSSRRTVAARAQEQFETFSPALERVAGDEVKRVDAIEIRRRSMQEKKDAAAAELADAGSAQQACALPDEGLPSDLVGTLRGEVDTLRDAELAVTTHRSSLDEAAAVVESSRSRLGNAVTDEQLRGIDTGRVLDLTDFARQCEAVRAEELAVYREKQLLRDQMAGDDGSGGHDVDQLTAARTHLLGWLRCGEGGAGVGFVPRALLVLSVLVISGLAVTLGVMVTPFLLLAIVLAALPGLALLLLPSGASSERATFQKEFDKLGVDPPSRWTETGVSALLDELVREIDETAVTGERKRRLAALEPQASDVTDRLEALEARRTALASEFGVALDAAVARDGRTLAWLVEQLVTWHEADDKVVAARAKLVGAQEARDAVLARLDASFAEHGYEPVTSVAEARARVDDLERRSSAHGKATSRTQAATKEIERLDADAEQLGVDIDEVFEALALEVGDRVGLKRLCDEHDAYAEARAGRDREEQRARDAEDRLRSHSLFDERALALDAEEIEEQRARAQEEGERVGEIRDQITTIRTMVGQARKKHDVAHTLAELRAAEDALAERREVDHRAVVGNEVEQWLTGETRDSTRPPVFRRAAKLFEAITRYRYELRVDDESYAFQAYDANQERVFELDELSSGTRSQLLLAVRVAFVEMAEEGVKLPLILDETLAISDDDRAVAIVDAVLQLCADGRQVFYFTAQQDEVRKWKRALDGKGLTGKFVNLAEGREMADLEVLGGIAEAEEEKEIPPPGDQDYEEYGRQLKLPGLDLYRPLGEVHVWYLLDDTELLWRMLKLGIERKGQFEAAMGAGEGYQAWIDDEEERRIREVIRALGRTRELWLQGRGKRVDRGALTETRAVGDKYLDEVAAIAEAVGGDADRFMEALEARSIRGFGNARKESCRERLTAGGYLVEENPLALESLRAEVIGMLSIQGEQAAAPANRVERILRSLPR